MSCIMPLLLLLHGAEDVRSILGGFSSTMHVLRGLPNSTGPVCSPLVCQVAHDARFPPDAAVLDS
jgi:hypothetical protein